MVKFSEFGKLESREESHSQYYPEVRKKFIVQDIHRAGSLHLVRNHNLEAKFRAYKRKSGPRSKYFSGYLGYANHHVLGVLQKMGPEQQPG